MSKNNIQVLFLPGANPEKPLAVKLFSALGDIPAKISTVEYLFWASGQPAELNYELSWLPKGHYDLVLTKSAGCLVFLEAAYRKLLAYDSAMLLGAPLNLFETVRVTPDALAVLADKRVTLVHQQDDSVCPVSAVKTFVINQLYTIEGSDHLYTDFSLYKDLVRAIIRPLT